MSGERRRIRVRGTVQGVGFRPFVHREATELGIRGSVRNDADGVLIDAEGPPSALDELERRVGERPPALARVRAVEVTALAPLGGVGEFSIIASPEGGAPATPVSVDVATCDACLAEVGDPGDRRYRYPFTNCTDCGPRYTIVRSVPYDRPATTMAGFTMCSACQGEYDDPTDRRFHAQPNACPECGPRLAYRSTDGQLSLDGPDALAATAAALGDGAVVAVKGLGGFHLAVDAGDDRAVATLRQRKARDDKPFAVMVADLDAARELCEVAPAAAAALVSPRRPIVLAPRRTDAPVAAAVAPGLPELGLLLAYTPLHHILLADLRRPLVMTSGNLSDEPIAHEDDDARDRLAELADAILGHDRGIHIRCDDSVARALPGGSLQVLRRSRGYAPEPLALRHHPPHAVLAVGAELKSTVSITAGASVVTSHHLGDLEHHATYQAFRQAIAHLCGLYGVVPEVVAHDLHPEYLSTKLAVELGLPTHPVQHHHAHIASCLAEHGRTEAVLGLAFDGLGMGTDGVLWGGELLVADLAGFRRVGHLRPIALPGGTAAIREPWRVAMSWLDAACGPDAALAFGRSRHDQAEAVLALGRAPATPRSTSVGRLFDAVAAVVGIRDTVTYEGQAAIELEAAARRADLRRAPCWALAIDDEAGVKVLDPAPLVAAIAREHQRGAPAADLAAGFHRSLGEGAADLAAEQARAAGLDTVALSGGVFQNALLSDVVARALEARGVRVLLHGEVPANDGGISVGQAAIAGFAEPGGVKPE